MEKIVAAVKQHELGTPVADIARKLGIAERTFYRWKTQHGVPKRIQCDNGSEFPGRLV